MIFPLEGICEFSQSCLEGDGPLPLGDVSGMPQMRGVQQRKVSGVQVLLSLLILGVCRVKTARALSQPWEAGACSKPLSEPCTTSLLSWRGSGLKFKTLQTKQCPSKKVSSALFIKF